MGAAKSGGHARATSQAASAPVKGQRGLHFDQHVGVPQQAILACEVIVQVQKCSETEVRRVSTRAVQESGESPVGSGKSSGHVREPGHCTSSGEIAMPDKNAAGASPTPKEDKVSSSPLALLVFLPTDSAPTPRRVRNVAYSVKPFFSWRACRN